MSLNKEYPIGSVGKLSIAVAAGEAKLVLGIAESVGGGKTAGGLKAGVNVELDLELQMIIDAGMGALEAKYASNPAIAGALSGLQALVDAELAKA